ncbi:MAG: hypothetical protein JNL74_22550, partial [Fibrobacteres bacterium]|nr:hypothetical protein [Fibrobacterota bacterium]
DVVGLQASGLLSRTDGNVRGGQTGFINIAHKVSGFQCGFINISDTLQGIPLGIINIARNGNVRLIAYGTSIAARNIGAQFLVNNWCSSISISNGYLHKEPYDDIALTTSFGYRFPLGRHGIVLDGASVIMQRGLKDYNDISHEVLKDNVLSSNQLRFYGDLQILKNLSLFAGGGVALTYNPNTTEKINRDHFDPMFMAGITLF